MLCSHCVGQYSPPQVHKSYTEMDPSKIYLITADTSSGFHIKMTINNHKYQDVLYTFSHQFIQPWRYQQQNLDDCLPVLLSVTKEFSHFSRTEVWKVLMKKTQKKQRLRETLSSTAKPPSRSSNLQIITHYRIHYHYHVWPNTVLMWKYLKMNSNNWQYKLEEST